MSGRMGKEDEQEEVAAVEDEENQPSARPTTKNKERKLF